MGAMSELHAAAEAAEQFKPASTALVRQPTRMLVPIADPSEIIAAQEQVRTLIEKALLKERDYGLVPGTNKPTLFKAGAERTILAFGCFPQFTVITQEVDHDRRVEYVKSKKIWRNQFSGDRVFTTEDQPGVSLGLYRYVVRCDIVQRGGGIVGSFVGSCSTMESKYIDRPRDCENTALKMAEKRAMVGATLVTFGLSDQFTQDMEDVAPKTGAAPADADGVSTAAEDAEPEITRESQITWGKKKDTPIKDLETSYLQWACEPDRKLGPDTAKWQAIMRIELKARQARTGISRITQLITRSRGAGKPLTDAESAELAEWTANHPDGAAA